VEEKKVIEMVNIAHHLFTLIESRKMGRRKIKKKV
jgi:hypothetical protein